MCVPHATPLRSIMCVITLLKLACNAGNRELTSWAELILAIQYTIRQIQIPAKVSDYTVLRSVYTQQPMAALYLEWDQHDMWTEAPPSSPHQLVQPCCSVNLLHDMLGQEDGAWVLLLLWLQLHSYKLISTPVSKFTLSMQLLHSSISLSFLKARHSICRQCPLHLYGMLANQHDLSWVVVCSDVWLADSICSDCHMCMKLCRHWYVAYVVYAFEVYTFTYSGSTYNQQKHWASHDGLFLLEFPVYTAELSHSWLQVKVHCVIQPEVQQIQVTVLCVPGHSVYMQVIVCG